MPSVGERKNPNTMGNFAKDPMYKYAASFYDTQKAIMKEAQVDYAADPARATAFPGAQNALKEFYLENAVIGDKNHMDAEEYQDQVDMMNECFINDLQAVRENAVSGMSNYNPLIGLSLPMHKYLMMNCVFAQAIPRYVAKSPSWTETMETRWMVTPDGKKIDIANQQNQIFGAWKEANKPVEVPMVLPELQTTDILDKYFHVSKLSHNLSVATHISAVAVEEYVKIGDPIIEISDGKVTEKTADTEGKALVWKPWLAEFTPGYGEYNRNIVKPVDILLVDDAAGNQVAFHDTIFATQKDNMFEINSGGKVKAVKMTARYDASTRSLKTNRVEWSEQTTFVQIPESDGITVPVTPEEVKDIGALYGINQVTKYMGMIKDVLENVKDDDIKEQLDESFLRLDDDHKVAKTYDMAPPTNYMHTYVEYNQTVFMRQLDQIITGLLTVLRDPNMQISIIGRPAIIRDLTPVEYTYTTPSSVGPVDLDFKKTVVTSDKRVYNFISSDKMWGNENLIILLVPKNTNRIVYRLYDYQMYISNEIRDAENPQLPALTAFQRYKFFEYQSVQGRLYIANAAGLRSHLTANDTIGEPYTNNDLGKVYTQWDDVQKKNVATPDNTYTKA